jgi:uncharacterized protein (TIGR02996 family)
MADRDALFQAILYAPDDDAPRLVFADWLDENGDPDRAEFIRVQCRLARLPFYEPECATLSARADELLVRHRRAWRVPAPALRQEFRRGFVETLVIEPGVFFERSADLYRQAPIRWVLFTGRPDMDGWDWDLVVPLEGLEFPGPPPGPISARAGHELPRLRRLKAVGLMECVDFLAAVSCPRLEAVDLSDSPAAPVVLEEFCHRAELGRVRALALGAGERLTYQQRMRAHGALLLAAMPGLVNLRELHLNGQLIGDAGLYHLAHSPQLAGVEELYLTRNEIGEIGTRGIEDLCTSLYLNRLSVVDLSHNPLGAAGARELAAWPGLRRLRWLNLTDCGLSERAGRSLAESPYLHDGLALALDGNRFDPAELFPPGLLHRPASVS